MASARFEYFGTTPHRHESEGIEWLTKALPDYEPFGGMALFSFGTDNGRRYEIDAIALTAQCLYVVELKAWSGTVIEGDARHLVFRTPERGREIVVHPLPLLETKMKSFASRLRHVARRMGKPDISQAMRDLWFEPLVWLTHATESKLGKHDAAASHVVVGRGQIGDALRQASFPGARDDLPTRTVPRDMLKMLRRVLAEPEFGLRSIDKPPTVLDGRLDLTDLVEEGDDYQDHWAAPHDKGPLRRVRSYLVPKSDRGFAQALDRRVQREADVLLKLGDHPNILALEGFDPRAPLGPALIFRGFPGKTLDVFVKQERHDDGQSKLTIDDKIAILRRVADALSFCHRQDVVHGAISPEAVLVQRLPPHRADKNGPFDVRLTRFALAAAGDLQTEGTRLFTRLAGASASLYEAPEVSRGNAPTQQSDMFSLGALAYYLLAEQPPARSAVELAQRLERDKALTISAIRDDLFPPGVQEGIDLVLLEATYVEETQRLQSFPTPLDFIDRLEEALTQPDDSYVTPPLVVEAPPRELDPLDAVKGDILGGDLRVRSELGSGATAKVFRVTHPREEHAALKVPLSEAHDERIVAEAEVLEKLRRTPGVDRIAHFIETREIGGRTCLLIQFAGEKDLASELRAEGSLSLDYARRWGDDLLTALRSLEEAGIQHRDIKPANIGLSWGAEKGKKRLLLFDFSLSSRPATDLGIGTPAYKDPELLQRGRWDDAADRWAAAITLHEMFTGVRPAPLPASGAAVAVRIEADRIDPDVRHGLVPFFERAFRFRAADRYATADDMRDAFIQALHKVPEERPDGTDEPTIQLEMLQGRGPESRVVDLNLSPRQRNALDRMGIYTLQDLAQLSSNRLSGIRGVGAKTARSLVELAAVVRKHLEISTNDPPSPFHAGFSGARRTVIEEVEAGRLSAPMAQCFAAAGLSDSVIIASAPRAQVVNLVKKARKDGAKEAHKDISAWLEGLQTLSGNHAPTTLHAAATLLAPESSTKGGKRLRHYLGLEDCPDFPRHGTMVELARATNVTPAAVSIDVGKARDRWLVGDRERAVLSRAYSAVEALLAANASVGPLAWAAAAVIEAFPREPDLSDDVARRCAEALVRAVTEVDPTDIGEISDTRLKVRRAKHGAPDLALVAWDRPGFETLERLGREADAAVAGGNVLAEATAAARFRSILQPVQSAPRAAQLAMALPDRELIALAVVTAEHAKISARGELYPAGLAADRALVLSTAALAGHVSVAELERRVRARYPDGAKLPEDAAALEQLARSLGLRYADGFFMPHERTLGLGSTEFGSSSSSGGGPVSAPAPAEPTKPRRVPERSKLDVPGATPIRVFEEELGRVAQEGSFRVLLWYGDVESGHQHGAPSVEPLARAISRKLDGKVFPLDKLLVEAAERTARNPKMRDGLSPVLAADAQGPEGPGWSRVLQFMRASADGLVRDLKAESTPRVLVRLGLMGRYDLLSKLSQWAAEHRQPAPATGRACTLVVLPVFAGEGAVVEVGSDVAPHVGASAGTNLVPMPGILAHEIMRVPPEWVRLKVDKRSSSRPPGG